MKNVIARVAGSLVVAAHGRLDLDFDVVASLATPPIGHDTRCLVAVIDHAP